MLLEILSGGVFLLFAISIKFCFYSLNINNIIYFVLFILYFASLFIIAGIDKENINIQRSVLVFALVVAMCYMTYVCIQNSEIIYTYIIYLCLTIFLLMLDIIYTKKKKKQSYVIGCLMLILYIHVFSDSNVSFLTIILTLFYIGLNFILVYLKKVQRLNKNTNEPIKKPIGFYLCVSNILLIILTNILSNYI